MQVWAARFPGCANFTNNRIAYDFIANADFDIVEMGVRCFHLLMTNDHNFTIAVLTSSKLYNSFTSRVNLRAYFRSDIDAVMKATSTLSVIRRDLSVNWPINTRLVIEEKSAANNQLYFEKQPLFYWRKSSYN